MADSNATGVVYSAEDILKAIQRNEFEVENILHKQPELIDSKCKTKFGIATPLIMACHTASLQFVQMLLKNGANVTLTGSLGSSGPVSRSQGGYGAMDDVFPLFIASRRSAVLVVEELLSSGADVNQMNAIGQSALHVAGMHYDCRWFNDGPPMVMRMLIENGAEVNKQDSIGNTPLHYVCYHGNSDLAYILLKNGADVTITNKSGFKALDIAVHCDSDLTEEMIEGQYFSIQEIINAYETVAIMHPFSFDCLAKATSMRIEYNIPKEILEPLECYGFTKEWQTMEELEMYENDPHQLKLQSELARERIFNGRCVNFRSLDVLKVRLFANSNQLNTLIRRYLDRFEESSDSLYFYEIIRGNNTFFNAWFKPVFPIDNSTLCKMVLIGVESCRKTQAVLRTETKYGCIQELISAYELVLGAIGKLIILSNKRKYHLSDMSATKHGIWDILFKEVYMQLPVLHSSSGYTKPLGHFLFHHCSALLCNEPLQVQHLFLQMFIDAGLDLDVTDSDGNTLLHTIISSAMGPEEISGLVKLLLDEGVHFHARNKQRKTALDLVLVRGKEYNTSMTHIAGLIEKYERGMLHLQCICAIFIKESNISYKGEIPQSLVDFVKLH